MRYFFLAFLVVACFAQTKKENSQTITPSEEELNIEDAPEDEPSDETEESEEDDDEVEYIYASRRQATTMSVITYEVE